MIAATRPDPPANVSLRDGDRPFWDAVMDARAYTTWNDSDLTMAGTLARCRADIERLQAQLSDEPDFVTNGAGSIVIHPIYKLIDNLSRRDVQLSRVLHVHAQASQGQSRETGKRTAAEHATKAASAGALAGDDDLIAAPIH